jgi:hypothetical protein
MTTSGGPGSACSGFSLFYATAALGLLLAHLADDGRRRALILAAILLGADRRGLPGVFAASQGKRRRLPSRGLARARRALGSHRLKAGARTARAGVRGLSPAGLIDRQVARLQCRLRCADVAGVVVHDRSFGPRDGGPA